MGALVALSLAFLGYVIINGAFKLRINTWAPSVPSRMLRRLRYQLVVDRVLRFPFRLEGHPARDRHHDQGRRGRPAGRLHR